MKEFAQDARGLTDEGHREAFERTRRVLTHLFGKEEGERIRRDPKYRPLITPVVAPRGYAYAAIFDLYLAVVREEASKQSDPLRCERTSKAYAKQARDYRAGALGCTTENIAYSEAIARAYKERALCLREDKGVEG